MQEMAHWMNELYELDENMLLVYLPVTILFVEASTTDVVN
jgi:hypothetical protein